MKPADLETVVQARLASAQKEIRHSIRCVDKGMPLAAERNPIRLRDRLRTKAKLSRDEADAVALGIRAFADATPKTRTRLLRQRGAEAIYGRTIDFVGVSFLDRGRAVARAVARVAFRDGRPQGSGFMVSDRLFLTNNHVIASAAAAGQFCAEFDYELDTTDRPRTITRFAFDPTAFFLSDSVDGLDYTLIAVGDRLAGAGQLEDFGWCGLSDAPDKHALGEVANIVQHPDGRYKEVVLRENRLVSRLDFVLHYVADTEPGSSGSGVFNNEWKVIALHHWGGPWRQKVDDAGHAVDRAVNEGIRVSAIVADVRARAATLSPSGRELVDRMLGLGKMDTPTEYERPQPYDNGGASPRIDPDGGITWRVPIEVSVRLPGFGNGNGNGKVTNGHSVAPAPAPALVPAEEATKPSQHYGDRSGYKPRFIEGIDVPLPALSAAQQQIAARNKQAQSGDDPFELKYHHFSVVMNKARRLAFFTACNIDGSRAKHVDRKTGDVTTLTADDPNLESLWAESEAAEASETWYDDRRLDPGEYAGKGVYDKQKVPGFPVASSPGRILRMFQRGHLVRRMDPAWGTDNQAVVADADTFHWTNCSPQVGFFNMGRAAPSQPGTGGGKLWRAVENYVLRNAVAEKSRVSSFTGPIFAQNDRKFRGVQVPKRFWKIVAWSEGGELRSLAMLVDQGPVLKVWPEALDDGLEEAYGDADELDKVQDFLTTVASIEQLTKLKFGPLRAADIRGNQESVLVRSMNAIPLARSARRRTHAKRGRTRANGASASV